VDLKELALVDPEHHWYYQSKLSVLQHALRRWPVAPLRLVDVGAGSGFLARGLARPGAGEYVVCVDPNYTEDERSEDNGRWRYVRAADPESVRNATVMLFIDVLEHVPDDVDLLAGYVSQAAPGTLVLITVPAFMSLWSSHDVFLEHYRRYRLPELKQVAERSGLTVLHQRYLFATIFPAVWVIRRLRRSRVAASDLDSIPRPINFALKVLLGLEHRWPWNRLFGVSAFLVAQVPDHGATTR